jgi:hypothetical protein
MNSGTDNSGFMLLFRGTQWHKGLSPDQMQQVASEWKAWFDRLMAQGKAIAGNPLESHGKLVSGANGRILADGPFAESKEAIGGYILLRAETLDEAVAIARECPGLAHGAFVEVRQIARKCPAADEVLSEGRLAQIG